MIIAFAERSCTYQQAHVIEKFVNDMTMNISPSREKHISVSYVERHAPPDPADA